MSDSELPKHCCYCNLIEYKGIFIDRAEYHRIVSEPTYTSGLNPEHTMCVLLASMSCTEKESELETVITKLNNKS